MTIKGNLRGTRFLWRWLVAVCRFVRATRHHGGLGQTRADGPRGGRRSRDKAVSPPPLLSLLLSLSLLFFQHSTWLGGQVAGGAVVTALGRSSSRLALPLVIEMRHSQRIPRLERKILEMNLPILLNISTNRCLVSSLIDRVSFHVLPKKNGR